MPTTKLSQEDKSQFIHHQSLSSSKGLRRFHRTASGLDGFVESVGD